MAEILVRAHTINELSAILEGNYEIKLFVESISEDSFRHALDRLYGGLFEFIYDFNEVSKFL